MTTKLDKLLTMDAGDLVAALQAKGYSYRTLSALTEIDGSSFSHYTKPRGDGRRKANEEDWRALAKLALKADAI